MSRRVCLLLVCAALLLGCEKHLSVLVLGIDGADWDVMDPLIEAG